MKKITIKYIIRTLDPFDGGLFDPSVILYEGFILSTSITCCGSSEEDLIRGFFDIIYKKPYPLDEKDFKTNAIEKINWYKDYGDYLISKDVIVNLNAMEPKIRSLFEKI